VIPRRIDQRQPRTTLKRPFGRYAVDPPGRALTAAPPDAAQNTSTRPKTTTWPTDSFRDDRVSPERLIPSAVLYRRGFQRSWGWWVLPFGTP
jgi:hypothetical protein